MLDRFGWSRWVCDGARRSCRWADTILDLRHTGDGNYPPLPGGSGCAEPKRSVTVGDWTLTPHRAYRSWWNTKHRDAVLMAVHADGYRLGFVFTQFSGSGFPYSQLLRALPYLHPLLSGRPAPGSPAALARRAEVTSAGRQGLDLLRRVIADPAAWITPVAFDDEMDGHDLVRWASVGVATRTVAFELESLGVSPHRKHTSGRHELLHWRHHGVADPAEVATWVRSGVTTPHLRRLMIRHGFTTPDVISDWFSSPVRYFDWSPEQALPHWRRFRDAGWTPNGLRYLAAQILDDRPTGTTLVSATQRWLDVVGSAPWAEAFLAAGYRVEEVARIPRQEWIDVDGLKVLATLVQVPIFPHVGLPDELLGICLPREDNLQPAASE